MSLRLPGGGDEEEDDDEEELRVAPTPIGLTNFLASGLGFMVKDAMWILQLFEGRFFEQAERIKRLRNTCGTGFMEVGN